MKLKEIIHIADLAYPDGLVGLHFDEKRGRAKKKSPMGHGDDLARFICAELCETYDKKASDKKQMEEAARVMTTAVKEVGDVAMALRYRLEEMC